MINERLATLESGKKNTSLPYPWKRVLLVFAGLCVAGFVAVMPPPSVTGDVATIYKVLFGGTMGLVFGLIYAVYKYFRR